jgi:hypothetical protein
MAEADERVAHFDPAIIEGVWAALGVRVEERRDFGGWSGHVEAGIELRSVGD